VSELHPGMYDPMRRRRAVRRGRERGCWVYIAAPELAKTRLRLLEGPPPFYRAHGRTGGRTIMVELFTEGDR
jgi:hypothetical protein